MTYYEILEVSETASKEVIQMAYKALAKKYHPDVFEGDSKEAEEKIKQINMAYTILSNPEERIKYDANLKSQEYTWRKRLNRVFCKRKNFYCVIMIVIAVCIVGWFLLRSTTQNIEHIKDSVVVVKVYNDNGDVIANGSGFCAYKNNWIVTNFHVIEGGRNIVIMTDDRKGFWVNDIILFNKKEDLAILQIDGELNPLTLSNSNHIKVQDSITMVGGSEDEPNAVAEGIICNIDNKKEIGISAPLWKESSGGVLLNQNNEVIGIAKADYEDITNLNYAINISVLEELYSSFNNSDTITINDNNLSDYIGNSNGFEENLSSSSKCFCISSLNTFFILTDKNERFECLLEKKNNSWYSIYTSLSMNDRNRVVDLFSELDNYTVEDNSVNSKIDNWNIADFLINLNVLNKCEYAIASINLSNYHDKELMFEHIEDNYPLEAAEKSLILYLIGGYEWNEISNDNKEAVFDYFDAQYRTQELGAILEFLGYEVVYENGGTLTAYW